MISFTDGLYFLNKSLLGNSNPDYEINVYFNIFLLNDSLCLKDHAQGG